MSQRDEIHDRIIGTAPTVGPTGSNEDEAYGVVRSEPRS